MLEYILKCIYPRRNEVAPPVYVNQISTRQNPAYRPDLPPSFDDVSKRNEVGGQNIKVSGDEDHESGPPSSNTAMNRQNLENSRISNEEGETGLQAEAKPEVGSGPETDSKSEIEAGTEVEANDESKYKAETEAKVEED